MKTGIYGGIDISKISLRKIESINDADIPELISMLDGSFATAMADCPAEAARRTF